MKRTLVGTHVRRVSLLAGLVFAALPAGSALATTTSFTTQGCGNKVSANRFTVPAGVSSVQITATGGAGQTESGGAAPGGTGDVVSGTLSGLGSGQILDVCVNAGGGPAGSGESLAQAGAGGGASGVALGSDFSAPVLIASGGGGGGGQSDFSGGGGGLPSGVAGAPGTTCSTGACGGGGGNNTTMMVGAAGAADPNLVTYTASTSGAASSSAGPGAGGAGGSGPEGGGGGGAGYFGGGGGGPGSDGGGGGGGGGSDFCASTLTRATLTDCAVTGTNSTFGTASVVLSYTSAARTVEVGQLFTPNNTCSPDTFLQTGVASGRSYTVPEAGVITSWSFRDAASTVSGLRLKVGRSAGSKMYTIVAQARAGTQTANSVNTYSAHIKVKAGDLIGLYTSGSGDCSEVTGSTLDKYAVAVGDQLPGTTATYGSFGKARFPISVKVALDCVVPKLKGKTLKAAKKALKQASCSLGTVTPKGQTTGTVVSQNPAAGKTLAPGAEVNIRLG